MIGFDVGEALKAILALNSGVMTLTEFKTALEVALDRGVVERMDAGLVPRKQFPLRSATGPFSYARIIFGYGL